MKFDELFPYSYRSLSRQWMPGSLLWMRCLSADSQFCRAVVANGYLSFEQMVRTAVRYRLGVSRQGGVIFWQIDHEERVRDGKVMYYREDCHRDKEHNPTWVSSLLRRRYQWPEKHQGSHCFFGTHLLRQTDGPVAVVESEKTAFIMSGRLPRYIWLAAGGLGEIQTDKFRPLRGRRVILFPDTDPEGIAYKRWYEAAEDVMRQPFWEGSPPIYVAPLLEQRASLEQKAAKIDIVDLIY